MEKTLLHVEGMSCEHCVKAVTKALKALPGVKSVAVDLAAKTVAVAHDARKAPLDKLTFEITDLGYEVIA